MQERRVVPALTRATARSVVFAIAAVVLVADRVTTSLALHHLHGPQHVWGPFGLALTFNSGFAFSLFSGRAVLVSVFLCLGVVVLAVIVAQARRWAEVIGGGLVLGGAMGNLSERLVSDSHSGQVPDFITLTHWPTFNAADAAVTVGVVLVALALLFERRPAPVDGGVPAADAPSEEPTA